MLQNLLSNIMDLPYPLSLKEAQKKLIHTYMKVNGKTVYIANIEDNLIQYEDGQNHFTSKDTEITSLEVLLPDTGIYFIDENPYYLLKLPKRQWKKSMSWDFYKVNGAFKPNQMVKKMVESKKQSDGLWKNKTDVYYLTLKIGKINKLNQIVLINNSFKQEVIDKGKVDKEWILSH